MRIRPIQQRFGTKMYLTHEEKVTSLAANCAAGCLHNQLHIELCLLELLRELSSAWYHYSRRTFDLQHTGSRAAWNEEDDSRQLCHHQTWHHRIRFTLLRNQKPFPRFFLGWTFSKGVSRLHHSKARQKRNEEVSLFAKISVWNQMKTCSERTCSLHKIERWIDR